MNAPDMNRVKRAFDEVIDAPADQRAEVVDRVCGADRALRERVMALLVAADGHPDFLSAPTGESPASAVATLTAPLREGPGTRIGPYKLLQLIGEGGFGSVFMAEQEKPVSRKVALKIIKLGMDTRQVVARFEQERQALALMDHPNIARVLDAGATETGRPYFVMELVKGDPIVEYCDKNNLSIEDRLELFAQVCTAVQHAHTKGIIHRDIKPSNILVSTQDGRPHTKVIDFGIAKATASKLTEKTLFTEHKALIGTPEYMSPEQAEGSLDIDTRTDVYSLGVLLYELLTGTTPFSSKELRSAAYAEIQRIIREVEPPKPSTRISQNTDTIASIAAKRHTEPKRLGTIVRGELDWIVMKALEKDRQRRYETANGLGMDIRRYLSGEAVVAAPPSTAYQFKKFIRRNRVMVTAGAVVATALLIGMVAFAWQARVANEQRHIAETNEQKAIASTKTAEAANEKEAKARKRAETISAFVTTALKASDAQNSGAAGGPGAAGQDITILAAMDNAVKDIDSGRFKDDPETEAGLRHTIGVILRNNGKYDKAKPLLEQALAMYERMLGGDDPIVASSLGNLALLYQFRSQYAQAEPLFTRALAINEKALGPDHREVAIALDNLAGLYQVLGRYAEAEPLATRALAIFEKALGPDHREVATALSNLASLYHVLGQYARAEPLATRALAIYERILGQDNPSVADCLSNLASLSRAQDQYALATSRYERALAIYERALGPDHPRVATSLNNIAMLLQDQGQYTQVEALLTRALAILERATGPENPEVANALSNLAVFYLRRRQYAQAEPLFTRSLAIYEKTLGPDHPRVAVSLTNLGDLYSEKGEYAQAEPLLTRALTIREKALGADHPYVLTAKNNLAKLYWRQLKLDKSVPLFEEALRGQDAKLGRQHAETLRTVANLGVNYMDAGRIAEAVPLLEEAYRASKQYPQLRFVGPELLNAYAKAADPTKPGDTARVVALMQELLAAARGTLPKDSPQLAGQLAAFGQSLLTLKAWDEAEPLLREALTIREKAQPEAWTTFNTKSMLGGVLLGQMKLVEAEPLLLDGYRGLKEREAAIPAQGKVRIPEALERLVKFYEAKGNESEAAAWRARLDAAKAEQDKPAPNTGK